MKNWKSVFVKPTDSIEAAIRIIEAGDEQICLVADDEGRLLGVVTDGDVRRGILRSLPLDAPVTNVMKESPLVASLDQRPDELRRIMLARKVRHLPLVDAEGYIVGLKLLEELMDGGGPDRDNWVVLMAGGLGNRLRPLTEDTPKPLLSVGTKPLLETIIESLVEEKFRRFFISLNYKGEMLKKYFGDGSRWGAEISYVEESERLGTAGALGLLEEVSDKPILVMNGDVLTNMSFTSLFDFHEEHEAQATMCVREYDFQIPYGVVEIDHHRLIKIDEKPIHRFFVNAGVYVLNPQVVARVPKNQPMDMPDLFRETIDRGLETAVFPIREYWLDIGRIDDFHRANNDFSKHFD